MKKLLVGFLGIMLLFAFSTPAGASVLVADLDPPDYNSPYWSGKDINPAGNLNNSGLMTEETWLNYLLGYSEGNPNWVDLVYKDEDSSDGWDPPANWTYAILKYGNGQTPMDSGFDHWAIMNNGGPLLGDVGSGYTLTSHALSHITYDTASVPEPATMFLLGSGLLGIGVFMRKKISNNSKT